jgi:hypothetical protein
MTGHTSAAGWVAWLGQSSELSRSDPITAVANALRARDPATGYLHPASLEKMRARRIPYAVWYCAIAITARVSVLLGCRNSSRIVK